MYGCQNTVQTEKRHFRDYVDDENSIKKIETSSWDDVITLFDTVPSRFGYTIFDEILSDLHDTAIFKRVWKGTYLDNHKINNVFAAKSNRYLDPNSKLSNDSYFIITELVKNDGLKINATVLVDFEKNMVGTFIPPLDSSEELKMDYFSILPDIDKKFYIEK